jgi:N-dimethylarginine dimethylaminohydrolase
MDDSKFMAGAQAETGDILKIALRRPEDAFRSETALSGQWQSLNYTSCPNYHRAVADYEKFADILAGTGADILYLPADDSLSIDSIYVRDAMITTDQGVILCNMGKAERQGEPAAAATFFEANDIPVLGRIEDDGRLEGGDLIWLDERTIVVGQGYRTNAEGIRQLRALTANLVDEIIVMPLPHWNGRSDVMHLMSNISPIDPDLAVVYSRLLTVPFRNLLLERGIRLVEVPDEEYESMACNVLTIGHRKCLMIEGNPLTRQRLEQAGVEVLTYDGLEISLKGAGGPTCLTRPLQRKLIGS